MDEPFISANEDFSQHRTKQGKLGHRVFCCCDSRKATILVSLVALVLSILAIISYSIQKPTNGWGIAVSCISTLFYILVIWGALRYHRCAVILSLIWQLVALVLKVVGTARYDWGALQGDDKTAAIVAVAVIMTWDVVVIYCLGTFASEVSRGIMTKETHSREKYSCCCNV